MRVFSRLKNWAKALKLDVVAIWIAARDPRTPWYAKVAAALVAGYALSPIDLIPDFIPVLGYLDDLLIVPVGILIVVRMIPPNLMVEYRLEAAHRDKPVSFIGLVAIVIIWLLFLGAAAWFAGQLFGNLSPGLSKSAD